MSDIEDLRITPSAGDSDGDVVVQRANYLNEKGAVVYLESCGWLTRDEARQVAAKLVEFADEIVEPDGITHVIDNDGDLWERDPSGKFNCTTKTWMVDYEYADLVADYGPLRAFTEIKQ